MIALCALGIVVSALVAATEMAILMIDERGGLKKAFR